MILSYKNKFVFLKNRKVGGSSVEIALSSICGENDIITPLTIKDELLRMKMFNVHCQNYSFDKHEERVYVNNLKKLLIGCDENEKRKLFPEAKAPPKDSIKYHEHMRLCEVINRSNININDFIFIHICRNPYEQIVSHAEWMLMYYNQWTSPGYTNQDIKNNLDKSLGKCIWQVKDNIAIVKYDYAVNMHILRYESLQKDFDALLSRLGFPGISLPHAKKSQRNKNKDMSLFDKEQIEKINEELHEYFEIYDYPKRRTSFPAIFMTKLGSLWRGVKIN